MPTAAKLPKEKERGKEKEKQKPTAASHPPYFQMIREAILALRDRTGSSPQAIAKYVEEKHKGQLPANFKKMLSIQLRSFAAKGKLVKVKASFKLSDEAKKKATSTTATEKPTKETQKQKPKPSREASSPARKTKSLGAVKSPKKAGIKAKRKAASPAKPKQPKSIKSPAAKKVKKKKVSA